MSCLTFFFPNICRYNSAIIFRWDGVVFFYPRRRKQPPPQRKRNDSIRWGWDRILEINRRRETNLRHQRTGFCFEKKSHILLRKPFWAKKNTLENGAVSLAVGFLHQSKICQGKGQSQINNTPASRIFALQYLIGHKEHAPLMWYDNSIPQREKNCTQRLKFLSTFLDGT